MVEIDDVHPTERLEAPLLAETVCYETSERETIQGYFARPLGVGPFACVLVIHHAAGLDEWTREVVRKFADHGYLALCPNLLSREMRESTRTEAQELMRSQGGVPDSRMLSDVEGGVRYLRNHPSSSSSVGIIGFCSGGRQAYLAACSLDVNAVVDCYGGSVVAGPEKLSDRHPVAPIDLTPDLACPFLGMFGDSDHRVPLAHIHALEEALEKYKKTYRVHIYPNVGHAFFCNVSKTYDVSAAKDGWDKILAFFGRNLLGPTVKSGSNLD